MEPIVKATIGVTVEANIGGDCNGDEMIGIQETISILQTIGGL